MPERQPTLDDLSKQELADFLCNAVDEQGYLFQEACAKAIKDGRDICWFLQAEEYPVYLNGEDTRIDIVLEHRARWQITNQHIYAVVECKRANPSYVCWLFGSPQLERRSAEASILGYMDGGRDTVVSKPLVSILPFDLMTYRAKWWLESKQPKRGDAKVSSPQSVETAFTQVLRGIGGLAVEQSHHRKSQGTPFMVLFVPVVVTTALLYVAQYKVADIELSSGTLDSGKISFGPGGSPEPVPWIQVQYGAGQSVTVEPIKEEAGTIDPGELLQKFKTRSIFVVNSARLVDFLRQLSINI